MTDAKRTTPNRIADVASPGKTAPTLTSKPVIVTNRAILKDPMMKTEAPEDEVSVPETPGLTKPVVREPLAPPKPADEPAKADPETTKSEPVAEQAPSKDAKDQPATKTADEGDEGETSPAAQTAQQLDAEAEAMAKHDAEIQKLVDGKKYFLPINAVEKRRSKRFVVLGIVLSIVLILLWVDVALDASLIKIPGVKPVTHLFSN